MRRLPQDNGTSALTTHQLQVERRESQSQSSVRSPHTSYRWRGERIIETIKCMLSPHTSYRWRGERVIEPIKCMRSPHTSYRWRGERVIEPIKWMGIIRRPWLTRASGGNLARTLGLHPYSFTMSVMGFLVTTESQDFGGCVLELCLWHTIFPQIVSHSEEVRQENNISTSLAT